MAKISRLAGSTGHVLTLFIQDSSSGTGAGLTGLAYNTAGLACYYKRNRGTASAAVSLATIATLGTYVSGGFKEVDSVNLPGIYEFHPPDAAMASGAGSVAFLLRGAANMAPCPVEIELTAVDSQDAQRFGVAALPASGTLAVTPTLNATQSYNNTGQSANLPANLAQIGGQTVTAAAPVAVLASVGTAATSTAQTGDSFARIGANGAGLTAVADTSGTTTLLTRLSSARAGYLDNLSAGAVALATQIPANFTSGLFASAGVFSTGAFTNSPTGSGGATASAIATAVWQDILTTSDFSTVGSAGAALKASLGANGANLNLGQTGYSPRALDSVADASLTTGDWIVSAGSAGAGKAAQSGTSLVLKTPSTGTTIRSFTLDSATTPTSRS